MSELAEVNEIGARTLTKRLADRFGVDENKMMGALKATAFKTAAGVTNEQLMALCIVAEQHNLNPWTKEIYAFPSKGGGIVPVVGVDGWARIINSHPQFDGMDFEQNDESCTCIIYRKDRSHPVKITEYMSECKQSAIGPWTTHPKRMLRHKAMIQCARIAFSYGGIYDQDEAERIVEAEVISPKRSTSARADALHGESWDHDKCQAYIEAFNEVMPDKDNIDWSGVDQLDGEVRTEGALYIAIFSGLTSWQRTAIKKAKSMIEPEVGEIIE